MENHPPHSTAWNDEAANETFAERRADNPSNETVLGGLLDQARAMIAELCTELRNHGADHEHPSLVRARRMVR